MSKNTTTIIRDIISMSEEREKYLKIAKPEWYKGYLSYLEGIEEEIEEVREEIKENNHVYLEDELGDIFWGYICLLNSLELDGYIDKSKVFERCEKKFTERLEGENKGKTWQEVKEKQKEELKKEKDLKFKE